MWPFSLLFGKEEKPLWPLGGFSDEEALLVANILAEELRKSNARKDHKKANSIEWLLVKLPLSDLPDNILQILAGDDDPEAA